MNPNKNILIGVGIIALLVAGAYIIGQNSSSKTPTQQVIQGGQLLPSQTSQQSQGEISSGPQPDMVAYSIFCFNVGATLSNCENGYAGGRSDFIVDITHQQVTTWVPDATPVKYIIAHRCAITDVNNWSCVYDDDVNSSLAFGFRNGAYFSSIEPILGMSQIYVTKAEWEAKGGTSMETISP